MAGKKTKNATQAQKSQTQESRAGLRFPVGRIGRYLREGKFAERTSASSAVMMAAVIEYMTAEILELAGDACGDDKRVRITPKHLQQGIQKDPELLSFMMNTTISSGGVRASSNAFVFKNGQTQE